MSLVNKMLRDLDARQSGGRTERPILQDLRPVTTEKRRHRLAVVGVLTAGVAIVGSLAAWHFMHSQTAPRLGQVVVSLPPPVAPAAVASAEPPVTANLPSPATIPAVPEPHTDRKRTSVSATPPAAQRAPRAASSPPPSRAQRPVADSPAAVRIEKTERPYTAEAAAEQSHQEAVRAQTRGNPVTAERHWRQALSSNPQHAAAREQLAGLLIASGRNAEAQQLLEQGIAQRPEHVPFRLLQARAAVEQGNESQALATLERALTDGVHDPELQALLAALYQRAARHGEAVKSYRDALAVRPQEGRWWLGLGISLEAQQDSASARDAYRRALGGGPLAANLAHYAEERLKALAAR